MFSNELKVGRDGDVDLISAKRNVWEHKERVVRGSASFASLLSCDFRAQTDPSEAAAPGGATVRVLCAQATFLFDVAPAHAGGWETDGVRISC